MLRSFRHAPCLLQMCRLMGVCVVQGLAGELGISAMPTFQVWSCESGSWKKVMLCTICPLYKVPLNSNLCVLDGGSACWSVPKAVPSLVHGSPPRPAESQGVQHPRQNQACPGCFSCRAQWGHSLQSLPLECPFQAAPGQITAAELTVASHHFLACRWMSSLEQTRPSWQTWPKSTPSSEACPA